MQILITMIFTYIFLLGEGEPAPFRVGGGEDTNSECFLLTGQLPGTHPPEIAGVLYYTNLFMIFSVLKSFENNRPLEKGWDPSTFKPSRSFEIRYLDDK